MNLRKIISFSMLAVIGVCTAVILTGCPDSKPLKFVNVQSVITVTPSDEFISEQAYRELEDEYNNNGGNGNFQVYLRDLLDSNGCTNVKIHVPQEKPEKPVMTVVYLDNTGSMKGFLEPTSGNVTGIVDVFNKLRSLEDDDTKAYYIDKSGLKESNLKDMASSINNRQIKTQDAYVMSEFLDTVVTRTLLDTDHDVISYFVSDAIISGTNSQIKANPSYNISHAGTLSTDISQVMKKLNGKDYGLMLMRFEGDFDGNYVTYDNKPEKLKSKRPFYVIAIGPRKNIASLDSQVRENGVFNPTHVLTAATHPSFPTVTLSYDGEACDKEDNRFILKSEESQPKVRLKFNLSTIPEYMNAEDVAREAMNVTFLDSPLDLSQAEYDTSSKIMSVNRNLVEDKTEFPFEVRVNKTLPSWVINLDSSDDKNIQSQLDKTFNLKWLVEGLLNGIYALPAGEYLIEGTQEYIIEKE